MTSDKKADANSRNALKSTGPKTPEGKAAVRLNALKHGLLSQAVLLPGEDEEALNAWCDCEFTIPTSQRRPAGDDRVDR